MASQCRGARACRSTIQSRLCYANGEGVPKDEAEAAKWYRRAAEQGFAAAQYELGACFANGLGVIRDHVAAYELMNLASAQGHELAKQYLSVVETRMTVEQVAEAQRLAREFKPRPTCASGTLGSSETFV